MKDIPSEIRDIQELNEKARNEKSTLLSAAEEKMNAEIEKAASAAAEKGAGVRIILLSGRSASGKTTFTAKLCEKLREKGREAKQISLDDFFVGTEKLPVNADGTYDFESLDGIDTALANRCFHEIIETGRTMLPIFDFSKQRRSEIFREAILGNGGILVAEGIHAMNPILTEGLPEEGVFRIFAEPETGYSLCGKTVFTPENVRLSRRITRDEFFRNWPAEKTFAQWKSVLSGEKIYIEPYIPFADIKVNTSFAPEPGIFLPVIEKLLRAIDEKSPFFSEAEKLFEKLSLFEPIETDFLAKDSLLREFLG